MQNWNKIPLFRLLLPLIIGIVLAFYYSFSAEYFFIISSCLGFLILLSHFLKSIFSDYSKRWVFGLFLNLFFVTFGIFITENQKPENESNHYTNYPSRNSVIRLLEDVIVKQNSYKCEVEVIAVKSDEKWVNTSGKAILYLAKDSLSELLQFGDELIINSQWKSIDAPTNPAQFNYKNYLYNSGILSQQYVNAKSWKLVKSQETFSITKAAFVYQRKLLNILKSNFKDDELSVLSALLLGYKDFLDREIIMVYSSSGAMHVLAVSGLHVGIIFMVLNSLLFFFDKIKYGSYLKAILLLLSLWIYALITGMSPSVLRAATMFSFVIVGGALKRQTNIYNTLAASAFILLLHNPFILLQVGFQLSYAAVLGIVYLQPKLYKWYRPSNWLLDKIWAITAVSIAAQIATFPLGIYYFNQFPNYFLLSNLFVIPLATFIIIGGILLFVIHAIPLIPQYLVWAVNKLLLFLNFSVEWVDGLPFSLSLGISITILETVLIYSIILLILPAFINRNFQKIKIALFLTLLLISFQIFEKMTIQNQHYFVVYNIADERAIDFVDGTKSYFVASEHLNNDQSKMRFNIMNYRWERGIQKSNLITDLFSHQNYFKNGNFIQFYDQRILLWDQEFKKPSNIAKMQFDFIIVSDKVKINLENITCKQLIIDSSVSYYASEQIKKECLKWDIPFYDVSTEGAYLFENSIKF